jgi:death-on-curing protein
MAFKLIHPQVLQTLQGEICAQHRGTFGLRENTPIKLLHAHARALNDNPATDLAALCAYYGYILARDQLFFDGNTALALTAIELLLTLNDHHLSADDTTCYLGMMVVANGELNEDNLAVWIRKHIVPVSKKPMRAA